MPRRPSLASSHFLTRSFPLVPSLFATGHFHPSSSLSHSTIRLFQMHPVSFPSVLFLSLHIILTLLVYLSPLLSFPKFFILFFFSVPIHSHFLIALLHSLPSSCSPLCILLLLLTWLMRWRGVRALYVMYIRAGWLAGMSTCLHLTRCCLYAKLPRTHPHSSVIISCHIPNNAFLSLSLCHSKNPFSPISHSINSHPFCFHLILKYFTSLFLLFPSLHSSSSSSSPPCHLHLSLSPNPQIKAHLLLIYLLSTPFLFSAIWPIHSPHPSSLSLVLLPFSAASLPL